MPPDDRLIIVERLSKSYQIWSSPAARLKSPLYRWIAGWPFLPASWRQRLHDKAAACYREFFALHDVSFEVRRGQSVGIIGRNGSGKSTLLQMITGTLQPSSGQAEVRGRVAALLELGSGFNPEFTGRENVRLNAALHGLTPAQIEGRLGDMLAFADIGDFVDQPVKSYSSGMMLRLAFAVIAHIDADILIIDEALAVGDIFFVQKCIAFLQRFQEDGILLLASHDPGSVCNLCQNALWIDKGHLRMNGAPKEVTEAYLEAFFEAETEAKFGKKIKKGIGSASQPSAPPKRERTTHDQRQAFLNHTQFRNDLQMLEFDPQAASFGAGGGKVIDVRLENANQQRLFWVVGGEVVTLCLTCESLEGLRHPIVGFFVKNHLGQQLFGDNTFLDTLGQDLHASAGTIFEARFRFQMPVLPAGDYSILAALADGDAAHHLMHHWVHDALVFKSTASSAERGLIGLPMLDVTFEVGSPAENPALETVHF